MAPLRTTFAAEIAQVAEAGPGRRAAVYAVSSVAPGLAAAWAGMCLAEAHA